MDFDLPKEITDKLAELDAFIEAEIKPLERENMQFFDHRREHARTDWDHDGRPRAEWRALISEMERRADKAGHLRYGLPKSCGGSGGLQSRDRGDPRASRRQGARPAQRPAGRILDRRQFPDHSGARRLRDRRAEDLYRRHHHWEEASIFRSDRARPRQRRDVAGDDRRSRRRPLDSERAQALEQPGRARARQSRLRPHVGEAGRSQGHHRLHRADGHARPQRPLQSLDVQHAERPRGDGAQGRARAEQRDSAQGGRRPRRRAALRPREPHPSGRRERRRRPLLHPGGGQVRQDACRFRRAARQEAGDPVPAGRALGRVRDGAQLHLPHRLADGPAEPAGDQRHGVDLQFPREPPLLRGGGPRDAGARRDRLQPRAAVRAYLSPPPPLSHHRGHGGGADAAGRAISVRLQRQARECTHDADGRPSTAASTSKSTGSTNT